MVPDNRTGYAVLAVVVTALGILLVVAPDDWYGPSWSYFTRQGEPIIPAGGFGMGLCLVLLGALQLLATWRAAHQALSLLFFLSGFVFLTAGLLLGAEGLLGHQGLMETPFMFFVAIHKFAVSVNVHNRVRHEKSSRP